MADAIRIAGDPVLVSRHTIAGRGEGEESFLIACGVGRSGKPSCIDKLRLEPDQEVSITGRGQVRLSDRTAGALEFP